MSDPVALQYRAFISYSRVDETAAVQLFRRLERFRLPRGIYIGSVEDPLKQERKLGRFFLDKAELGAERALGPALRKKLDVSQSLIVICSPAAARSDYVAAEISYFREHYPDRTILTYAVAGDPGKNAGEQSCFPQPLIPPGGDGDSVPLAADIRNARTREMHAQEGMRIVSGLTGYPYDNLWQRWARERRQRLARNAAFAVAVVAVLCFGVMAMRNAGAEQFLTIAQGSDSPEVRVAAGLSVLPAEGAVLPVSNETEEKARQILFGELYNDTPNIVLGEPQYGADASIELALSPDGKTMFGRARYGDSGPGLYANRRSTRLRWDAGTLKLQGTRLEGDLDSARYFNGAYANDPEFGDDELRYRLSKMRDSNLAQELASLDPMYFAFDQASGNFAFANYVGLGMTNIGKPSTRGVLMGMEQRDLPATLPVIAADGTVRYYNVPTDRIERWGFNPSQRLSRTGRSSACPSPFALAQYPGTVVRVRNGRFCITDVASMRETVVEGVPGSILRFVPAGKDIGYLSFAVPVGNGVPVDHRHRKIDMRTGVTLCEGRGAVVAASPVADWVISVQFAQQRWEPGAAVARQDFRLGHGCGEPARLLLRTIAPAANPFAIIERSRSFLFHPGNGELYWVDGALRRSAPEKITDAMVSNTEHGVRAVAVTDSGRFVATLHADGAIEAYRVGIDGARSALVQRFGDAIGLFADRGRDGFVVVSRSEVVRWDAMSGASTRQPWTLPGGAAGVAMDAASHRIGAYNRDGYVQMIELGKGAAPMRRSAMLTRVLRLRVQVTGVNLSEQGKWFNFTLRATDGPGPGMSADYLLAISLAAPLFERAVKLPMGDRALLPRTTNWDEVGVVGTDNVTMYDGKSLTRHRVIHGWTSSTLFAQAQDGKIVAHALGVGQSPDMASIGVFEDANSQIRFAAGGGAMPTALGMDQQGRLLAIGGDDGRVRLWHVPVQPLERRDFCSSRFWAVRSRSHGGRAREDAAMGVIAAKSNQALRGLALCPCRERGPLSLRPAAWPAYDTIRRVFGGSTSNLSACLAAR